MYRNCIYCSAHLGENEVLEQFPVGRSLAFDGVKGRLWAVCPACARWNLAPLEERWEAVEAGERLFRDCRVRAHSENVGLAKLRDGTRLIRVGDALPGELAVWRYTARHGRYSLLRDLRATRRVLGLPLIAGGTLAMAGGILAGAAAPVWAGAAAVALMTDRISGTLLGYTPGDRRVVHVVNDPAEPGPAVIRRGHVDDALLSAPDGRMRVMVPFSGDARRGTSGPRRRYVTLWGEDARLFLTRAMTHVNGTGASRWAVEDGAKKLRNLDPDAYVLRCVEGGLPLVTSYRTWRAGTFPVPPQVALALEMALHEVAERRALQGELAGLEEMWRQAEEIAAIADRLPDLPPAAGPRA